VRSRRGLASIAIIAFGASSYVLGL
jgi:hypothetical protein